MDYRAIWFKKNEFNKLVNAVRCNEKEKAFDMLYEIVEREKL